ncbi:kinase-like domain, phloem protein 2-like protein [Tanacetum coccineum]
MGTEIMKPPKKEDKQARKSSLSIFHHRIAPKYPPLKRTENGGDGVSEEPIAVKDGALVAPGNDTMLLTWLRRLEICVGLAHALSYIHYDEPRDFSVIHRKISSYTVLLNDEWEPKLCDFEFSMKIKASEKHNSLHTNTPKGNKFTFVELLQCLPLIENLEIDGPYMEGYDKSDTAQISKNFPDIQDYSGFALDHLELFRMEFFTYEDRHVDFLKLLMAKSPMLKKAQIELYESVSLEEENELLRDLLRFHVHHLQQNSSLYAQNPPHDGFCLWKF